MSWISDNLQTLATLGSALAVYIFIRKNARRESDELRSEMRQEFKEIKEELKQIDRRLTRLEGRFDERGYWESREYRKTGTEHRK